MTVGLFLNPFGYDFVVYGITSLTKDYWMTMGIMYTLTFLFFGMFIYFSDVKLFKHLRKKYEKF